MNTTTKHRELTDIIEEELKKLPLPSQPFSLYEPVRYTLSLGGKRVRPYFTLIGCGLCGGQPKDAIPAALAIELLHNFTLLHDDIMDAAETRRGELSVFKKWNASTAILSGDAMYAWAFQQLQYYGNNEMYSKEEYASIMSVFLESVHLVCEGQAYDLEFETRDEVSLEEYLKMIGGKTAALISGAFCLGGAVARADGSSLQLLHDIGRDVGIAFQIQDDLLDVIADPGKFGKTTGGDIAEGKKTYLSILSLQQGNEAQRAFLHTVFDVNGQTVTPDDIERVISIYKSLGIIEQAGKAVDTYYKQALSRLDSIRESDYKRDLIEFLNNLIKREY